MHTRTRLALAGMCWVAAVALGGPHAPAQPTLDPATQPRFVNALPIPAVLQPTTAGGSHYEVSISQLQQDLGLVDPVSGAPLSTTVWGYAGSYPGPTIEARSLAPITVLWKNELVDALGRPLPHLLPVDTTVHWAAPAGWPGSGVPVVTHLHGGHSESASDGLPDAWFTPGFAQTGARFAKSVLQYDNDQEAATLWYHDHALGITRLNVYAGLAGFYLLRDTWEVSLPLPRGRYEVPIAIQDRMFTTDGSLFYPSEPAEPGQPNPSVLPEFFGDIILVNGKAWPRLDVEPRQYRFRILNGSDSRFYRMWLDVKPPAVGMLQAAVDDSPALIFAQIGSDGGLLEKPVRQRRLVLGPGERADVVVDFSRRSLWGTTVVLRNDAPEPFPDGDPTTASATELMAFRVGEGPVEDQSVLPTWLRTPIIRWQPTAPSRELLLFEGEDEYGRLQPLLGTSAHGPLLWSAPTTEKPFLGDTEIWSLINFTEDAHPIHLHLVQFQVLDRQDFDTEAYVPGQPETLHLLGSPAAPPREERGFKDTVKAFPGEVTRVIARFDRPGRYVWHCHILSHEDHEMMREFEVVTR